MRHTAAGAACALTLAGLLGGLEVAAADERVIQYSKDTLTVHLTRTPVSEVLEELSRQSGADIRGQVRAPRDVSVEFEAVPLPEALHRLLGDQNFALIYGDAGTLKAVRLLGGPLPPKTRIAAPPPTLPPMQAAPANLASLVARHSPVAVTGHLADIVGAPNASLQRIFDIGMHSEDASARAEAVGALVSTLEGDAALRAAVIGELSTLDDTSLSSLLRGAAGEHAEELAAQVLTQSRASELRAKASSVLQRLRAGS